jgi:hypothetical protein
MNSLFKTLAGTFVVLGLGAGNLQAQNGKLTKIQVTPYTLAEKMVIIRMDSPS